MEGDCRGIREFFAKRIELGGEGFDEAEGLSNAEVVLQFGCCIDMFLAVLGWRSWMARFLLWRGRLLPGGGGFWGRDVTIGYSRVQNRDGCVNGRRPL